MMVGGRIAAALLSVTSRTCSILCANKLLILNRIMNIRYQYLKPFNKV